MDTEDMSTMEHDEEMRKLKESFKNCAFLEWDKNDYPSKTKDNNDERNVGRHDVDVPSISSAKENNKEMKKLEESFKNCEFLQLDKNDYPSKTKDNNDERNVGKNDVDVPAISSAKENNKGEIYKERSANNALDQTSIPGEGNTANITPISKTNNSLKKTDIENVSQAITEDLSILSEENTASISPISNPNNSKKTEKTKKTKKTKEKTKKTKKTSIENVSQATKEDLSIPGKENTASITPISNTSNSLKKTDIENVCETIKEDLSEGLQSKEISDFIKREDPTIIEYRKGVIKIPSSEEENKLMVITKNDLKEFLQDNCINTQILINEIRASNMSLIKHFEQTVGYAFKEINDLLKEMKEQTNNNNNQHKEESNAYTNYPYQKIMKDNEEIKNVMTELINSYDENASSEVEGNYNERMMNMPMPDRVDRQLFILTAEVDDKIITKHEILKEEEKEQKLEDDECSYHIKSEQTEDIVRGLMVTESNENEFCIMDVENVVARQNDFSRFKQTEE